MIQYCEMVEVSFTLLALLGQNVTVISMLSLDFTRSGKSESFFGTGISLCLRHLVETLKLLLKAENPRINHYYSLFPSSERCSSWSER